MAAGELWGCVEREQHMHLELIHSDPSVMWKKLETIHMQKHPGTHFKMQALHPTTFDLDQLDNKPILMTLYSLMTP